MKVGFVIGADTYSSSLYSATVDVANELRNSGVDVDFIFTELKEPLKGSDQLLDVWGLSRKRSTSKLFIKLMKSIFGYHVYYALFSWLVCKQLETAVNAKGYDVIVFHVTSFAPFRRYRLPSYVVLHTCIYENLVCKYQGFKKSFYHWFYRFVYSNQRVLSVSESAQRDLVEKVKAKPKSIETVFNGFDLDNMARRANEDVALDLPKKFIMAAGRPDRTKRFDVLIRAFEKTEARHTHKLVIFGEGRALEKLKKLAHKLGVDRDVIFYGFVFPILPVYKYADAYVLSSDIEGLPTVIIESLVAGTAVAATDAGGVRELLRGSLGKYICAKGDVEGLANSIDLLLREKPEVSKEDIAYLSAKSVAASYQRLLGPE
jgi:glycosyltransferase involved in cell wall biosynthesis